MRNSQIASLCVFVLMFGCWAECQQQWRYNLKAGDHLVYTEMLEKETVGAGTQYKVRATFENHIVVLDESWNSLIIGIQRNRESADLLQSAPGKKPPSDADKKNFEARASKWPERVAEANQISRSGGLQYVSSAVREWPSRVLVGVELLPLVQAQALQPGDKWRGGGYLNPEYSVKQVDSGAGSTATVEGTALAGRAHVVYLINRTTRAVERVEFNAEYGVFNGTTKEHVVLTLKSATHDETLPNWLASPTTRLAALSALERFSSLATFVDELRPMLDSGDAEASTLALSIIARRRMSFDANSIEPPKLTAEGERLLAKLRRGEKLQPPTYPPGTTMQLFIDSKNGIVPYIVRLPRDYSVDRPAPLLVYLSGGPGIALDAMSNALATTEGSEYAALYPNALDMWWEPNSTGMFDSLLAKAVGELKVSPQRTFVAGFSNGGSGAESYAARWPNRFGAVVSLMGAGVCGVVDDKGVDQLSRVPLLLVHGRKDKTIDPECSQQLYHKLQRKRANVQLEMLDTGHDVTIDSDKGLTMEFLRKAASGG